MEGVVIQNVIGQALLSAQLGLENLLYLFAATVASTDPGNLGLLTDIHRQCALYGLQLIFEQQGIIKIT